MIVSIIAAMSQNGVVGKNGVLPWKNAEEMKFFKEKTTNHPVIMGRKTWDSLQIKPLKNRFNIIVTRNKALLHSPIYDDNTLFVDSVEDALDASMDNTAETFIIGGTEIWKHALDQEYVDRMYLNILNDSVSGDAFFPYYNVNGWVKEESKEQYKTFKSYTFIKRPTE